MSKSEKQHSNTKLLVAATSAALIIGLLLIFTHSIKGKGTSEELIEAHSSQEDTKEETRKSTRSNNQRVKTEPNRFYQEFEYVREEQFRRADIALLEAESLIVDFGSESLNGSVREYQELSLEFRDAIVKDDIPLIRSLAAAQKDAFRDMVTKVEPLSVENRELFNKYFFKIGEAWAPLLMAGRGADFPLEEEIPDVPADIGPLELDE